VGVVKDLGLTNAATLTVGVDFCWTLAVATLAAVVTFAIVWVARRVAVRAGPKPFLLGSAGGGAVTASPSRVLGDGVP